MTTMRAVVLSEPGPIENLTIQELPVSEPAPGRVLIKVAAFGLNRSELRTRLGMAEGVTFPRVLGIEAAGTVVAAPGGEFEPGQQVVAMMGGMGRTFDGGYAEYTSVPVSAVIPFRSDLSWERIGAVPETLQTAYGSLTIGLDLQKGQTLLVRGGTSSVGMAAIALARSMGATVLATSRRADRLAALAAHGVDHPLVDDGELAKQVRAIVPDGVDAALELVGAPTLPDTLRAVRLHGTVCFSGILSNSWTIPDFYPMNVIPNGVRLTAYGGDSSGLPAEALQHTLDGIADGSLSLGEPTVYAFDDIRAAHDDMEHNRVVGKIVVLTP